MSIPQFLTKNKTSLINNSKTSLETKQIKLKTKTISLTYSPRKKS